MFPGLIRVEIMGLASIFNIFTHEDCITIYYQTEKGGSEHEFYIYGDRSMLTVKSIEKAIKKHIPEAIKAWWN